MKVWVVSRHGTARIERILERGGARVTGKNPDFVVAFGGDGTILEAEARFPGVPKIPIIAHPIRSRVRAYRLRELGAVMEKLRRNEYSLDTFRKVEGSAKGRMLVGLNEIQLRNADPSQALRFSLSWKGGRLREVVGDGIVVATPYGSTGYYRALGGKPFERGLRAGFNNVYPPRRHIVIDGKLEVEILRQDAVMLADNSPARIRLRPGDRAAIRPSREVARFVRI